MSRADSRSGAEGSARTSLESRDVDLFAVLDHLLEGCQLIDFDYRYRYINAAGARHGRSTPAELQGRDMRAAYPGIEQTAMFTTLSRCMRERTAERMENEFIFADGSRGWFELHFEPVPAGVFVLSIEITERKRAEERLRSEEALLDATQRLAKVGGWRWDIRKQEMRWTRETYRIHGFAPEAFITGSPEHIEKSLACYRPQDRPLVMAAFERCAGSGEPYDLELPFTNSAGQAMWIRTTAYARREEGELVEVIGNIIDVTEQHQLVEQLHRSRRLEAIGQLAGGVAHDFNNLLTVINNNAEFALDGMGSDGPGRAEIEDIRAAGQRAADLTRQLLAFGRKQVLEPRTLDLRRVITEIEGMLRRLLGEDIHIAMEPGSAPRPVRADPSQLEQVVINLAVNARDAMPRGGRLTIAIDQAAIDPETALGFADLEPSDYVVLRVTDTGEGMDSATRDRAFEPFFTTKERAKGTGLGLSTVYGIVKQSSGHVIIDSRPGRGTTVTVYLPLAVTTAQ
jgi:PAS domain S-box-containing protein